MIVFDIETGPLAREVVLDRIKDFVPEKPPGKFNPDAVKIGNLKDQAKITAKIEAEREKHDKLVANYKNNVAIAKEEYEKNAVDRAALSAITGEVLAIGYKSEKAVVTRVAGFDGLTEIDLLVEFWTRYQTCIGPARKLVGHNIFFFDLPFLIQRSWINDVTVPVGVIDRDRFWNERIFIDTMKKWTLGRYGENEKLDTLSKLFGGAGKPEGMDGSMFADLIKGDKEQQKAAIDYLISDLDNTWITATSMGVV